MIQVLIFIIALVVLLTSGVGILFSLVLAFVIAAISPIITLPLLALFMAKEDEANKRQ